MTVKPKKLINTFNKIGQGVLHASAFLGIISKYPIEHGDNYTKWSDGTLEQWGSLNQVASQGYTSSWGNSYHTPYQTWTFPIAFNDTPDVTVTSGSVIGGQGWLFINYLANRTSAGSYAQARPSAYTGTTTIKWVWFARGRWR